MSRIMNTDGTERGSKQSLLTQKRLLEVLIYDPETGVWLWRVSTTNSIKAGSVAGCIQPNGYRRIGLDGVHHRSSRLAFLYMEGRIPEEVDHENRVRDDDRMTNLRDVTRQENNRNRSKRANNTSGVTGVSFHKQKGRWEARIKVHVSNKRLSLGYYSDFHSAVFARYCGELKYNWSQSDSNTTAKQYVDRFLGRENQS